MKKAISLFSGAGIGDLGFRAAGIEFIIMCELEHDRAKLAELNFPDSKMYTGSIYNHEAQIIEDIRTQGLKDDEIFLISCTAPCQGMSKSGRGKLLREIREGRRSHMDSRNQLILPALNIIKKIRPLFVIFENVVEMRDTLIDDGNGKIRPILEIVESKLSPEYVGHAYDVEFADYGIPQRRKRLITVYTRQNKVADYFSLGMPLIPPPTHSKTSSDGLKKWVSVTEALKDFPMLDARNKETAYSATTPFHRVPVLDEKKYEWIRHTPPGSSAFDNQCINPKCGYQGNRTHGSHINEEGINQARKDTPLYCDRCGEILPRPYVELPDGSFRIMKGYTSAYKRMEPDLPSPALTRNMSFPCSDNKIHPYENRVLSLAEAFVINSINEFKYAWGPISTSNDKLYPVAPDSLVRLVIGESIPPKFTKILSDYLINLSEAKSADKITSIWPETQFELFTGK